MKPILRILLGSLMLAAGLAQAAPDVATMAERLIVDGRALAVKSVAKTPLPGIVEVRLESGETLYSDLEGKHFIVGDLFANRDQGLVNLTQQGQNAVRIEKLAAVPENDKIVFRGEQTPKATLQVFTDVTCPYCRKLHEEVPQLNDMGIAVEYLAFPRSGLNSEGARLMSQVWCAANPSEAMSAAKRGETLKNAANCDNTVARQYHLGRKLGVQGTPAIVLPDGRMIPGYVPAERLAGMLGING
jgi:thiol:disulfide interchange protein DsbC